MEIQTRWTCTVVRFKAATFFKMHPDPDEVADAPGREGRPPAHVGGGYGVSIPVFCLNRPA